MAGDPVVAVLGIDPGDTAGFLLAGWEPGQWKPAWARAYQCDGASAQGLLIMILQLNRAPLIGAVQIEAFDSRPGVRKLHGTSPTQIQHQIAAMKQLLDDAGIPVVVRQVSDVKTWAQAGDRIGKSGFWDLVSPAAMIHARSAGWHCLFCAVMDCGVIDPLSRGKVQA